VSTIAASLEYWIAKRARARGDPDRRRRCDREIRRLRLTLARNHGTHSEQQWCELQHAVDYCCVRCGRQAKGCLVKDHIVPIYMGGCDSINNIQPLCVRCNSSKGAEMVDWRSRIDG
jgi:5-methylcytosine-specific restriction endonuclease McrA